MKLIHGECLESVDHAWISVFDPATDKWKEYDLTRENIDVPPTHIKKIEVDSWEEIRDQIENDHLTMVSRRKDSGII